MARRWRDLLLSLGESFLGVLEAEAEALKSDLRASGRQASIALALGAAAIFILFWSVGAAGFVLYQVVALWMPGWGASLVVLGLFLLLGAVLLVLTRRRWSAIEGPAETIRRRYEDHVTWWEGQMPEGMTTPEPRHLESGVAEEVSSHGDET